VTRAVVIGDTLLDVTINPSGPMRPGADVPAAIRIGAGGQGANLAVRLARQGVDTHLVCGLGDDAAAEVLRPELERSGVRLQPVAVDATGTVAVLLDTSGERTMLSHRAPFASGLDVATLPDADWTLVSGYVLLEADVVALARSLAERPGRRALVGCDVPAESVPGWRAAAAALEPDLVILNRDEAGAIGVIGDATVVTDVDGAAASLGSLEASVRAAAGPPAVDTTGAGDAFAAGLIAALPDAAWPPDRDALEAALGAGVELAAAVARVPGAQARVAGEPR
jgi:ribokinase